jgi:hypothetical protein
MGRLDDPGVRPGRVPARGASRGVRRRHSGSALSYCRLQMWGGPGEVWDPQAGRPAIPIRTAVLAIDSLRLLTAASKAACLSQQGCQLQQRRQRRNRRIRVVERGLRSEPAWLRAHPGLHFFELEKRVRTQIPRNVWDTETAGTGDGVNYNSERKLPKRELAQSPPDKLQFTENCN